MWKMILTGLFFSTAVSTSHALADTIIPVQDTLSFSTSANTTIDSSMATVVVTVKSTIIGKNSEEQQVAIIKRLQSFSPSIKWRVISMGQEIAESGAKNMTLKLWAQIPQTSIAALSRKIDQSHEGYKMRLMVMNYDPSDSAIEQAKHDLMIQLYRQIKTYVVAFNRATQENYRIQTVRFSTMSPQPVRTFTLLAKSSAVRDNSQSQQVPVSKAIQLNASVTLARSDSSLTSEPIGKDVLPPAYLQVNQFKDCLSQADRGTWKAWCMPANRPEHCPAASWKQLQALPAKAGLSDC